MAIKILKSKNKEALLKKVYWHEVRGWKMYSPMTTVEGVGSSNVAFIKGFRIMMVRSSNRGEDIPTWGKAFIIGILIIIVFPFLISIILGG